MSLRKVAALLAAFGLMVGLIGIGSGVGAQFTASLSATENIHVGSFGCIISGSSAGTISGDQTSVVYNAPDILSSAAGSAPFTFTVKSTGSIPVKLQVSETTPPSPFTSILAAPVADVVLTQNQTHDYDAGLQWTELGMGNLGTGVGIVYTINCVEVGGGGAGFSVGYYAVNNGGTEYAPGTWCRSTAPIPTTAIAGGGTAYQSLSSGALNLDILSAAGYADTGFYVPLGSLGSISSGYSITATGPVTTNLYFDTNGDGQFFAWTNGCMSSLDGDTYAAASPATTTVTPSTTFQVFAGDGAGNTYTLAELEAGDDAGIGPGSNVAAWVGIDVNSGSASATITAAP
ncbi:MAG: hypothetical protein ACLQBX_10775 [Candidatus Limnocylindrales bacterium]